MIIPIVFATDDNYVLPLCVAIKSLINNKNKKDKYFIYIFNNGLSEDNTKILNSFNYACKILLINVEEYVKNTPIYANDRFPISACFRFFISQILSQYKKVLYLDCDVIVKKDIAELYNRNLEGVLVGAVRMVENTVTDSADYFNSGIMLFNIEEFNKANGCEKCLEYMLNNTSLDFPDEQVLNEVCKGRVKYLPQKYNFQTWYAMGERTLVATGIKRIKDISIIHYSDKPWKTRNCIMADVWWGTAKTLPKEIYNLIKETYKSAKTGQSYDYYKYYFANAFKKFFIKLKRKTAKK